jgi:hypothetical protein
MGMRVGWPEEEGHGAGETPAVMGHGSHATGFSGGYPG